MIHFTSFVFSVKFVSGEILCSPLSFQCESVFFCALRGKIGTWIGTHILEESFKKAHPTSAYRVFVFSSTRNTKYSGIIQKTTIFS